MHKMIVLLAATVAVYGPKIEVYKIASGQKLTAHIFRPAGGSVRPRPAVLLFHRGGWAAGSPEWVYDAARRYASRGAVAIAGEYRLSDQKTITPLDAMADARDLVRWTRRNATGLGAGAKHYCDRITALGGQCELHVYQGVGHLFTRKLDNQEDNFDPNPGAVSDAQTRGDLFLASRGFLQR